MILTFKCECCWGCDGIEIKAIAIFVILKLINEENYIFCYGWNLWMDIFVEFVSYLFIPKYAYLHWFQVWKWVRKKILGPRSLPIEKWGRGFFRQIYDDSMGQVARRDKYTMIRWVRSYTATDTWSMCGSHRFWLRHVYDQWMCITRTDMYHYYLTLHSIILHLTTFISSHNVLAVMIIWSAIGTRYLLYYLTCLYLYMISFNINLMTLDELQGLDKLYNFLYDLKVW